MKQKKLSFFQRLLFKYRDWKAKRNALTLNKMVTFNMFEAIRLANKKRDISNHKTWVISGNGEYLVFLRYQKMNLQLQGLLNKNLTSKELDEKASYIAHPITEKNKKAGGLIRIFSK
jgi:hypothetical protein